jgi:hypothetical protein
MTSLTLITDAGNFRAFKILIAAEYNGLTIDVPDFKLADRKAPSFLAKSPKVCANLSIASMQLTLFVDYYRAPCQC